VVGTLENSDFVMCNSFFIGVYPGLTADMLEYVVATIRDFVTTTIRTGIAPFATETLRLS
jgi:CDP-6-deoxy-D-xylo-4-hexulose-3-dehydrase